MEGLPTYSTVEVSKHSTTHDAWIIVGGKVLDVTSWMDEHPGGDDVLLAMAGMSTTQNGLFIFFLVSCLTTGSNSNT